MAAKSPERFRVIVLGVALISSVLALPAQAQGSRERGALPNAAAADSGYAAAAEGGRIYYEIHGRGDPIVVVAGALMPMKLMAQITGPLSKNRRVIAIDLEGHGRTGLRPTPLGHERNGDDIAAVLRHLEIDRADIAGYSYGGDAAIRMAVQHPQRVRNLIVIATGFSRDGWFPEGQKGMASINGSMADQMKRTPFYEGYGHPDQFSQFLDRMGELGAKHWDWREELRALRMPILLVFADHDSVSLQHIAEFFALFGGGIKEPGWEKPQFSRARLAIIPGYSHYNLVQGPEVAEVIEKFLTQPTSPATQFTP